MMRSRRAACGVRERRSDGKLPAHVITYLTLALALFADDDYEEVATRVTGSLDRFGCWDATWSVPTASAITQARKRLGREVFPELFERTCGPVAGDPAPSAGLTALGTARGSFLRGWRLVAIDGFEVDVARHVGQRRRVRVRRLRGQPGGHLPRQRPDRRSIRSRRVG
jgi:Insertion element 4 transposase N-terminal